MMTLFAWLAVDVLEGQLRDVNLLALKGHLAMFLDNLGALVACVQVGTHILDSAFITIAFTLRRLLVTLFDRDTLRSLSKHNLCISVIYFYIIG